MEYRAAQWISANGQTEVRLTGEEHADLPDDALIAEALAEFDRAGMAMDDGKIVISTWRE